MEAVVIPKILRAHEEHSDRIVCVIDKDIRPLHCPTIILLYEVLENLNFKSYRN